MALCYYEAAINRLTNPALDPVATTSGFKHCAVRASLGAAAGELRWRPTDGACQAGAKAV